MTNTINFLDRKTEIKGKHTDEVLREADEFESWCNQQMLKMENSENFDEDNFINEIMEKMNFSEGRSVLSKLNKLN